MASAVVELIIASEYIALPCGFQKNSPLCHLLSLIAINSCFLCASIDVLHERYKHENVNKEVKIKIKKKTTDSGLQGVHKKHSFSAVSWQLT